MNIKYRVYVTLIIVFIFTILALGSGDTSSSNQNSSSSTTESNSVSSTESSGKSSTEGSGKSSTEGSNDLNTWNKTAGETNGNDWEKMTNAQKKYLIEGVIYTMKENGYKVDVDAEWFIDGLNSFYGSSETNNTSVAEAIPPIAAVGKVIHKN